MSKNDITGDEIKSKLPTKEYEDNYERIFRKNRVADDKVSSGESLDLFKETEEERRINIIGQNGNDGSHYITKDKSEENTSSDW